MGIKAIFDNAWQFWPENFQHWWSSGVSKCQMLKMKVIVARNGQRSLHPPSQALNFQGAFFFFTDQVKTPPPNDKPLPNSRTDYGCPQKYHFCEDEKKTTRENTEFDPMCIPSKSIKYQP